MKSIYNDIINIRNSISGTVDRTNDDRYRIVFQEKDSTKTAYYFSTPIYNQKTRKILNMKFCKADYEINYTGSNAEIKFADTIQMENEDGLCKVLLPKTAVYYSDCELRCGDDYIFPTTNGFAYKAHVGQENKFSFDLEINKPFLQIRGNSKYFALMGDNFRPFVTVSCIGTLDLSGQLIAPTQIAYQKVAERKYHFTLTTYGKNSAYIMFEINLYEPKLFQDTTVESANPTENNVYGGTAFLGNTEEFGEQWLYTKPDFLRFSDMFDKQINRATLYLPKLNKNETQLSAFKVASRFCSFGSNWENKRDVSTAISDTVALPNYHKIDITDMLIEERSKHITSTDGMILRTKAKGSGFSVIATADSCFSPQILEIKYK